MAVLSSAEVRNYARALVLVSRIRDAEKSQAAEMPDAPRDALNAQLHDQVSAILQRFDLDRLTFNRISARVETDSKLRQRVQQLVIGAQVGSDT